MKKGKSGILTVECPECGYPIPKGLEKIGVCPECGMPFITLDVEEKERI